MHVEAERAAVDLGSADRYEIANGLLDRRFLQRIAELEELLEQWRGLLHVVDSLSHVFLLTGMVGLG
jgi:hypothetical protein